MKTVNRTIYLRWKIVANNYAFANKDVLMEPERKLGTSRSGVARVLSKGIEQKSVMQTVINLSPESDKWDTKLEAYWNALDVSVPEPELELDVSFTYDITDVDKLQFVNLINGELEKHYKNDKRNLKSDNDLSEYIDKQLLALNKDIKTKLSDASKLTNPMEREKRTSALYKDKWDKIFDIESNRYKVGKPVNPFDYAIYKYCLVFAHVANEKALINKSGNIRFYLYSADEIEIEKKETQKVQQTMMSKLLEIIKDVDKIEDVLYAMGFGADIPKDDLDKQALLMDKAKAEPNKFVSVAENKAVAIIGKVERYVAKGIFNRLQGTNIIVDGSNSENIIGNTLEEAISYMANETNKGNLDEFKLKLENLPK